MTTLQKLAIPAGCAVGGDTGMGAQSGQRIDLQSKAAEQATAPHRGRALIADDEAAVRLVLREMLTRLGYDPICAEDGQIAIDLLDHPENHFSLMICDLTMPNFNGLQVLEHAGEVDPGMPTIITTGYDDWNSLSEFAHDNLLGILPKPFGMPELRGMLEERLGC